jgi:16S rRNA (guanine527-N7)-methyltransferase
VIPQNDAAHEIQEAFAEAGIIELPDNCFHQFSNYLDLMLRWNARLSLTAIRERKDIIRRHFAECAFAAQHLPANIETLLDYGSGPGLPGIPFAICHPEIRVTLAEAQGRKAAFLREVVRVIGTHTEVHDGRVETMAQARPFHAVSMRAVEKMELAIPIALPMAERYLLLFTTDLLAPRYERLAPGISWQSRVHLPNSDQIILSIGERRGLATQYEQI